MIREGKLLQIHENDNVAVALDEIAPGEELALAGLKLTAAGPVEKGHKIALRDIREGQNIVKYAYPIGHATKDIHSGEHVHTHNTATNLGGLLEYNYAPYLAEPVPAVPAAFMGYVRENGEVGVRNEIWIITTVGCVNKTAEILVKEANVLFAGKTDGIFCFTHPYGCSQLGDDQMNTRKILAGLVGHPNAGGVLVVGLGCENNNIGEFKSVLGNSNPNRVKFLQTQSVGDEIGEGLKLIGELVESAGRFRRQKCPASKLVVGFKCGGSDAFSGITANPLVGAFSDKLTAQGGTGILTEVPEMFGAETILMNRCEDETVFRKTVNLINDFKDYFIRHNQVVYENPSPGNKAGGITTLEEKSLGCTQKGGTGNVVEVAGYGDKVTKRGLNLLSGPGNDIVASTALVASGAQIVLFTTGRGTPLGSPVPTVKISSNTALYSLKRNWIDFNAGQLLEEGDTKAAVEDFFNYVLKIASGEVKTKNEENGYREIAIFKDGVTL